MVRGERTPVRFAIDNCRNDYSGVSALYSLRTITYSLKADTQD